MEDLEDALIEYISVLQASAIKTSRAEDRVRYKEHLAAAALMFAALRKSGSIEKIKELVASERRTYGWGYLDGSAGSEAEKAFNEFAEHVGNAT